MTDDPTRPIDPPPVEPPAEPPAEPTAAPVMSAAVPGGGANRARWAIGLGVAGLAIAGVITAILLLGSRPTPAALTYIPADAVMVVEVRPDLPGDQLQKLGNLLAHFPGFADQSTLPAKLDESFAQLLGGASGGGVDYRADIKPWLSGPAFAALLPASDPSGGNPMSDFRGVASLTTTGTVSCDAIFRDQTVRHETYQAVDLVLGPTDTVACAVTGTQALLGDPASVRAALDAHANGSGLDRSAAYEKARASLEGDRLGTMYLSGTGYLAMLAQMTELTPGMSDSMACLSGALPAWMAEGLRAEDDAIVLDAVVEAAPAPTSGASPGPSLLPVPPAHSSAILPLAAANTLVLFETQGIGANVANAIAQLRACPMYAQVLGLLDGAGDPAELLGWIEDVGLLVVNADDGVTGGLVVVAKDAAAATQRAATLKGLLTVAQLAGVGVETRESTIAGVTVTTVTISNLGSLVPPGQLPGTGVPEGASVELSIAVKDRVLLLSTGESFMTAALTVQPGAGLVDQASYKTATAHGLSTDRTTMYIAIRDIVGLVEPLIPADSRTQWETEIKPYVAPFQALSLSASTDQTSRSRARLVLTITNP